MQIASRQPLWDEGATKGTVLVVAASAASRTVQLTSGTRAAGSESIQIDWGDGTKQEVSSISYLRHTYPSEREYKIKISDDLQSFGYTNGSDADAIRQMLKEIVSVGSKVTSVASNGFNNCRSMRGVINLPNVTSIGSYAFGSACGITDFMLPSMTRLVQTSFYYGPTASKMYCDNVTQIDSEFWGYYGGRLVDLYIRNKTCQQIKSMSGFPFRAGAAVRFHGSDGIVTGDGRITLG